MSSNLLRADAFGVPANPGRGCWERNWTEAADRGPSAASPTERGASGVTRAAQVHCTSVAGRLASAPTCLCCCGSQMGRSGPRSVSTAGATWPGLPHRSFPGCAPRSAVLDLGPAGPPWPPSQGPGSAGGELLSLCSWSLWHFKPFTHIPDSEGGMRSSRMSHSFLPTPGLFETPRVSRQPDQLLHFASNGQLCKGTKPPPPFQRLLSCFWKLTPRTSCDSPIVGSRPSTARGAVERGPELFRHVLFQCFLCGSFESGAQRNDQHSCFQIGAALS